jgi:hypothetical protein
VFVILLELRHKVHILHTPLFLHFREISSSFSASGLWTIEKGMGDASVPALLNEKWNDKERGFKSTSRSSGSKLEAIFCGEFRVMKDVVDFDTVCT